MTSSHSRMHASDGQSVLPSRSLLLSVAALLLCAAMAPARAESPQSAGALARPVSLPAPSVGGAATGGIPCPNVDKAARFDQPLARTGRQLAAGLPIKIVAIGSSSTAGAGASLQGRAYPNRLALELARRFRSDDVNVVNRGVNGEEANDMMARFETEVMSEKPDLVLWQVGTNSLLRDRFNSATESLIHAGIRQLKPSGADIVLMDAQFAPKVLAKAGADEMVHRLAAIAKEEHVQVFRRYAMMRQWHENDRIGFDTFVSSDGLHMNDWSYGCLAKSLGIAIAEAATRPTATASANPAR